ncbi:MAG TPA: cysteine dioxygenase family protein [Hyphomicrobiaceae bacterium]|nr:cysteine dioxygenase family protein [Hyphomicrobiaceae bacterium]
MTKTYSIANFVEDLRAITRETSDEGTIISRIEPLARRLAVEKAWLEKHHYNTDPDQGFGVHLLHEEPDHSLAVFAVAWLPGRGAPPHDHGTWAVVAGVEGSERNILYKRDDDRSRADHAQLSVKSDRTIQNGEIVSMKTGGIHSVINESNTVSLSLHTYGKHLNHTGRAQYDLTTNAKKDFIVTVA